MPKNFSLQNLIASEFLSVDTSGRWNIVGAYSASIEFNGVRPQFIPPLYIFISVKPELLFFTLYFKLISPDGKEVIGLKYDMKGNYEPGPHDIGVWGFQLPATLPFEESGTYLLSVSDAPEGTGDVRSLPIIFTEADAEPEGT